MSTLTLAIAYMEQRCELLDMQRELACFNNRDPSEYDNRIVEAKHLLGVLKELRKE